MNKKAWFTFVELIVVVTILGILSTLWFISYTSSLWDARDSTRQSDIAAISSALKQYKQSRWAYPIPSPWDNFFLNAGPVGTNTGAIQWTLNSNVTITTLDNIPRDPFIQTYYSYWVTPNRQEYQLAATLENGDTPLSILKWDFTAVAKDTLPTIIIATSAIAAIDIIANPDLFVFDNQIHNLVYDFSGDKIPTTDGTDLATLLSQATIDGSWWQNSDFESCSEIQDAWKDIGDIDYEIIDSSTWLLTGSGCTF